MQSYLTWMHPQICGDACIWHQQQMDPSSYMQRYIVVLTTVYLPSISCSCLWPCKKHAGVQGASSSSGECFPQGGVTERLWNHWRHPWDAANTAGDTETVCISYIRVIDTCPALVPLTVHFFSNTLLAGTARDPTLCCKLTCFGLVGRTASGK